jgi:hypothetical protein
MPIPLRLSLAANLVLVGTVVALLSRNPPAAPTPDVSATTTAPASPEVRNLRISAFDPQPEASTGPRATPAAIDQLEQMGLSRDVIVNALLGEFHRGWDQRFNELEKQYAPGPVPEQAYIELGRQRDVDQARILNEALGEARYLAWDQERTLNMLNPGGLRLNPDEAEQVYRLQKAFDERNTELQMALEDGFADGVDVGALYAEAQEARDRALEELLGTERFDRMRGVIDPFAEVYQTFGDMDPTPEQAQAVVRVDDDLRAQEAALAAQLRENPGNAAQLTAELQALREAREENLREILGFEAYEASRRERDGTFRRLNQFAVAWELSEQEIHSAYNSLRAFQDQANRTRSAAAMREAAGQPVDWHEVNAAIEQARHSTESGLESLLGPNRAWRLKQDGLLSTR